ncbi:DUF2520 domain-containing protein [Flavobacterium sp. TP390]|uniref:DUF2520 domain-containing protein n=1 Tax=Flavobacterium profundi TaxID=1774945 RepID=A0A6I4IS03_9FLAO|nr:Rossmann-like and DUF2520 domain-containing protein [Flavobacterium profundi]MVO08127.1 DUF2520 domain-containing protein [Flavobacterium profundi]
MLKVIVIGSGNVAQHLIKVFLQTKEVSLVQAFARKTESLLHLLPKELITNNYKALLEADVYLISVTDNAIHEVSNLLPFKNKLVVHTSGTSNINVLSTKNRNGVFYPLQTFSKDKAVDFSSIPICLEAENTSDYDTLEFLAKTISNKVYSIDSVQRSTLHVAAVFVSNFVNHMYVIGNDICQKNKIPFEILQPLIQEVATKISVLTPKEAQTGPALRNDTQTIEKHLEFLKDSNYQDIYQLLTQSIQHVAKEL